MSVLVVGLKETATLTPDTATAGRFDTASNTYRLFTFTLPAAATSYQIEIYAQQAALPFRLYARRAQTPTPHEYEATSVGVAAYQVSYLNHTRVPSAAAADERWFLLVASTAVDSFSVVLSVRGPFCSGSGGSGGHSSSSSSDTSIPLAGAFGYLHTGDATHSCGWSVATAATTLGTSAPSLVQFTPMHALPGGSLRLSLQNSSQTYVTAPRK